MPGTNLESLLTSTVNVRETEQDTGYALTATCTGTPPTTANVFAPGCVIVRTDAGSGVRKAYENVGTAASPTWRLMGPIGSVSYNVIRVKTNGTTAVNILGATSPYALTVSDVLISGSDDANGNIRVMTGTTEIVMIAKGSTSVVKGTPALVSSAVASGATFYTISSTSANASVFIFYSTSN